LNGSSRLSICFSKYLEQRNRWEIPLPARKSQEGMEECRHRETIFRVIPLY
jgi:hypothetical protein